MFGFYNVTGNVTESQQQGEGREGESERESESEGERGRQRQQVTNPYVKHTKWLRERGGICLQRSDLLLASCDVAFELRNFLAVLGVQKLEFSWDWEFFCTFVSHENHDNSPFSTTAWRLAAGFL